MLINLNVIPCYVMLFYLMSVCSLVASDTRHGHDWTDSSSKWPKGKGKHAKCLCVCVLVYGVFFLVAVKSKTSGRDEK